METGNFTAQCEMIFDRRGLRYTVSVVDIQPFSLAEIFNCMFETLKRFKANSNLTLHLGRVTFKLPYRFAHRKFPKHTRSNRYWKNAFDNYICGKTESCNAGNFEELCQRNPSVGRFLPRRKN